MRRNTLKTHRKKSKWDDLKWCALIFILMSLFGYMAIGAYEWQRALEAQQDHEWYQQYKAMEAK